MSGPSISALISGIPTSLGAYAPVIDEIETALQSADCSLVSVAEAIEREPTARLLKLGNSSFYGFSSRLTTVHEAISLIGIQQVQDLIQVSAIIKQFAGVAPHLVSMESFWRHSLACGLGARLLAMEKRLPKPDKFFVAGLLHDVGRLVLFSQAPKVAEQVFDLYRTERLLLREAEQRVLGYDHQQIGEALVHLWQYPAPLVQAIAWHHRPVSGDIVSIEAAIVHLSDHLVNSLQLGSSGERYVPPVQMKAWEALRFSTRELGSVMAAIDQQIEAVEATFLRSPSMAEAA